MPPQPRRTRANPSPSGLRELPTVQKTRKAARKAQEAEEVEDDTIDSQDQHSLSELSPTPTTTNPRKRAGKYQQPAAGLDTSTHQGASTQTTRYNTRSHTRSISPEAAEHAATLPAPQTKQTGANTRSKKRVRTEETIVEEEQDGNNVDEQRPAKRNRPGRPKKAEVTSQPASAKQADSPPIASIESSEQQGASAEINVTEHEDTTDPHLQAPGTAQNDGESEEILAALIVDESEPAPSIQTAHFRQTFGSQKSIDNANTSDDVFREQDLATHKTPQRKKIILNSRTEPRRGGMLKLSERSDTDILLDPAQKLLYTAWLKDEYCKQYKCTAEKFDMMSVERKASTLKLMRKRFFKPSRTFAQYLQDMGHGAAGGRSSAQGDDSNGAVDHDESEEEDSMEFSVLPNIDSPELLSRNPKTPGGKEQRGLETSRVQSSRPSMSQSKSTPRKTLFPTVFKSSPSKEALLTDLDVLEAAKVVSQVFAADQSRRGKPFPNAERLGEFLDQFQQEEVASSRKVTTPKTVDSSRYQSRTPIETSKSNVRSPLFSASHDDASDDETASPASTATKNQKTPQSQTPPEAKKSRGWFSSFTSTITSPLKKFGLGGRSPTVASATGNPAESGILMHGGPSTEDLPTPTRKPASQKFGANRNAGIKAAVDRRKERSKAALQAEDTQVPVHLRGVMTPEARAALLEEEEDIHGEARRRKREAAQEKESEWTEEYIDERGYDMVATWVMEPGGKRKRMVSQRLKNPSYEFPESSDDDATDAEDSDAGSPQFGSGTQSNITPADRQEPPRKKIFQQARRAIGLDTPPSVEDSEEYATNPQLDEDFGDIHHARPYTGKYFKTSTSVGRNVHEGRNPLFSGSAAAESTGNVFEEQTREGSSGFDAMFPGFRPPSSGSSSGESVSESEEHVDPNVAAFAQYMPEILGKSKKGEQREGSGSGDDQSALQEKQWTQSPPPKPKPSNATLPGKQISDEEAAKAREARIQAEKYLPKKPSRLREVEQASPIHQKENGLSQFSSMVEETMIEMGVDADIMAAIMNIDDGVIVDLDIPARFSVSPSNSIDRAVDLLFT